jgi:hypothetical protein
VRVTFVLLVEILLVYGFLNTTQLRLPHLLDLVSIYGGISSLGGFTL